MAYTCGNCRALSKRIALAEDRTEREKRRADEALEVCGYVENTLVRFEHGGTPVPVLVQTIRNHLNLVLGQR